MNNLTQAQTHYNVMELLVAEEIEKQLAKYPENLRGYINPVEVATFALNRLPSLYASCKQGFQRQQSRGKIQYSNQIKTAVRQGLAAVQQDPIRRSTPLNAEAVKSQTTQTTSQLQPNNPLPKELTSLLQQVVTMAAKQKMTKDEIANMLDQQQGSWADPRYRY